MGLIIFGFERILVVAENLICYSVGQYYTPSQISPWLTTIWFLHKYASIEESSRVLEVEETVLIVKCFVDTDIDMELRSSGSTIGYRQMTQDSHRSRALVSIRIILSETC